MFQKDNGLGIDGIVGPTTAKRIINTSANPCGIYGNKVQYCFLGVQDNDVLGTLYTIEDSIITQTMPARFGNPNRSGGKATPEGNFAIYRTKQGPHAGSNCKKVNGVVQPCMENPLYFNGGMAIHGTDSPQNTYGSLGCIGVSYSNSKVAYESYEKGVETVLIVDLQRRIKATS